MSPMKSAIAPRFLQSKSQKFLLFVLLSTHRYPYLPDLIYRSPLSSLTPAPQTWVLTTCVWMLLELVGKLQLRALPSAWDALPLISSCFVPSPPSPLLCYILMKLALNALFKIVPSSASMHTTAIPFLFFLSSLIAPIIFNHTTHLLYSCLLSISLQPTRT